ncbi:MAG: hypothetical protein ACREXS_08770 [Gammaproteobacteria bacterium]
MVSEPASLLACESFWNQSATGRITASKKPHASIETIHFKAKARVGRESSAHPDDRAPPSNSNSENRCFAADRYLFAYNGSGSLMTITDRDGDITRIEGDAVDNPVAIVSADGQRTILSLDANGYLASVTNPAGEAHRMVYTAAGLMTRFTDPKDNANRFEYDDLGRLLQDTNAGLGGWTIARTENATGYTNAMTTAERRTTTFTVEPLSTGDRKQVNAYPDGTVQTKLFKTNSEETTTDTDGTCAS